MSSAMVCCMFLSPLPLHPQAPSQALPTSLPMATKDQTVELETPVNKKSLAKALTPPVTLHTFFKKQTAAETTTTIEVTQADKMDRGVVDSCLETKGVKSATGVSKLPSSISKPKSLQMKLVSSFAKAPPPSTPDNPILIDGSTEIPAEVVSNKTRRPAKRKSEDVEKGAPILKALKRMERKVVVMCPVCSKEFSDVTNFDINRHLDACLGSSLSSNHQQSQV